MNYKFWDSIALIGLTYVAVGGWDWLVTPTPPEARAIAGLLLVCVAAFMSWRPVPGASK